MRRVILAIVSTAVGLVLLLTFKTHGTSAISTPPAAISTPAAGGTGSGAGSTPAGGTPSVSGSPGTTPGGSTATAAKTVTGAAADTIYGPVQVQITVRSGKLTAVRAVEYPENDPRDAQINAYAIPALNREALTAGSAKIDMISGATYTSQGYIGSLQRALDQAGL
jgi:uncharacterized protein with FMN-binding domain